MQHLGKSHPEDDLENCLLEPMPASAVDEEELNHSDDVGDVNVEVDLAERGPTDVEDDNPLDIIERLLPSSETNQVLG